MDRRFIKLGNEGHILVRLNRIFFGIVKRTLRINLEEEDK